MRICRTVRFSVHMTVRNAWVGNPATRIFQVYVPVRPESNPGIQRTAYWKNVDKESEGSCCRTGILRDLYAGSGQQSWCVPVLSSFQAFILVDWIPMFIGIQGRRVRRISYFIQIVRKNEA